MAGNRTKIRHSALVAVSGVCIFILAVESFYGQMFLLNTIALTENYPDVIELLPEENVRLNDKLINSVPTKQSIQEDRSASNFKTTSKTDIAVLPSPEIMKPTSKTDTTVLLSPEIMRGKKHLRNLGETEVKSVISAENQPTILSNNTSKDPPGLAWLASYPNSGTSYTLEIIRKVSDLATATNYGKESTDYLLEKSVPFHPSFVNGPFKTNDRYREAPEKFVLTKTHCGSRCLRCGPSDYMETEESFLQECLSTTPVLDSTTGKVEVGEIMTYDRNLVKKAVHLIRDPFDNIVSRFHHAHKMHRNDEQFKNDFPKNSQGFQAWCADLDKKYSRLEEKAWGNEVFKASKNVPCRAEFFRYIQWHNLASVTLQQMEIPTLLMTYEDYAIDLDGTLSTLLDFLELPNEKKAPGFHQGDYSMHFSLKQRIDAMNMMKVQASKKIWENIAPYRKKVLQLKKDQEADTVSSK